jgi:predicted DNA-binding transcriptional regulator YafY
VHNFYDMETSRATRIIQILISLQSGQTYTVSDLAARLRISRRMVFRDLLDLQKAGVPIRYDAKAGHYTIAPYFFFRPPDLTIRETLGLSLLVHKAITFLHFPLRDSALQAFLKIENYMPPKIKLFCNRVVKSISIGSRPAVSITEKIFLQLIEAILKKRVVNVEYCLPEQRKSMMFDLNPYHLFFNDHVWYVLGKSDPHRVAHTFKLNQIKKLTVLDRCFVEDEKFNLKEELGRAWLMVPEGKLYHVKLRFLPEVAHDIAEVQWHDTQTVTFENDGSTIVEFHVDGLSEITWWILGYGDKVQVLEPRILRQKIIEIAQNVVRQNEQLTPDNNRSPFGEKMGSY